MKELLSPAGNIECVYAAVRNGADAIYLGGKNFGARKYASNFTNEELKESTGVERNRLRGLWYIAEIVEEKDPKSSIIKDKFRIDFAQANLNNIFHHHSYHITHKAISGKFDFNKIIHFFNRGFINIPNKTGFIFFF